MQHESPLGKSHHQCLVFDYFCCARRTNSTENRCAYQHVQSPTHFRAEQEPTLIDLILTNLRRVGYRTCNTNHHWAKAITSAWSLTTFAMQEEQISNSMENRFAYAKGNYEAMREKLMGANLAARIQALGVQEAWDLLAGEIQAAVGEFLYRWQRGVGHRHINHSG